MTSNGRENGITTALIYTRVSSEDQAREGISLDAQLTACRKYAAEHGWLLGNEYQDVLSGMRDDRPHYQAMLAEIRRLRVRDSRVAVVVMRLDRFGRRLLERVQRREELKTLGVPTHSVAEGGEVNDLMANFLALLAEEEVRRLGERVSAARRHLVANGWQAPGRAALGYRRRPATDDERRRGAPKSVLEVDPERAPVAREMFVRVDQGASVRSVSRWLGSLPADVRGGRACSFMAVRRLLSSFTYVGRLENGQRGNWEPLIDEALFARVQARIEEHRHMPRQASKRYLLTGLLRCPACGGRMSGAARGLRPACYQCRAEELGAAPTRSTCRYSASVAKLDALVLAEVAALLEVVDGADAELRSALRSAWQALGHPTDETGALARAHEQAANKARERIKRLALLFADGEIDREGYELGRGQAQDDLQAAEAELGRLQGAARPALPLPSFEAVLREAGGWCAILDGGDVAERRDVFGVLIARVIPERVGYGKFRVSITWSDTGERLRRLVDAVMTDRARVA